MPIPLTIGALCKAKRDGKTKHIGVSNFTTALLDEAWAATTEPLVCNQIEAHPFINQDKVIAASKKRGMAVVAYVPIARGKVPGAEALERIGKAHGKSAAQVSLRYLVELGSFRCRARPIPSIFGPISTCSISNCRPRRWPSSRSSTPPVCAWSIRRTRRCGIRLEGDAKRIEAKGFNIPIVGLGTWALRGRDCARLTEQAIRIGYRHIDTAQMYDNEAEVGEGVRASGKRNEVMVTTKVQPTLLAPRDLERSVKESLAKLRLDHIDLLLIHWPNPRVPLAETLGAMAKMKREGYTRQIGVSNFTVALLDEANKVTSEPLVCNQIECHPYLDQDKVIAGCRRHGMAVVAYSPIARGQAKGDELLARIGKAARQERGSSVSALAHPAGHRGDPAHQQDRAAGRELQHPRFRFVGHGDEGNRRSCAQRRPHRRLDLVAKMGLRRCP